MDLAGFTNPHVFPCSVAFKCLMTWELSAQVEFHTEGTMNKTDKSEFLCLIENGAWDPFLPVSLFWKVLGGWAWGCPRGQIEDFVCGGVAFYHETLSVSHGNAWMKLTSKQKVTSLKFKKYCEKGTWSSRIKTEVEGGGFLSLREILKKLLPF